MARTYNKLIEVYPEIAAEWHPSKNGDLSAADVAAHSNRKVWWKCNKGHEWQAVISARTGQAKSGCPVCSNRIIVKGYNDLLSQNPSLCDEWDYDKNAPLKPDEISATSVKKVWWCCNKGHSFEKSIYDRNKGHRKCPYCSNVKFSPEYNSLALLEPELSKEWDYDKNAPLTPADVKCGGNTLYWWKCKNHPHSYKAKIWNRMKGSNCPYCSSQVLLKGFNDLETKNPEALKLWNYERNTEIMPSDVMAFSNIHVWWKCPDCNYEWRTTVSGISSGTGCPRCSNGYKVSEAEHVIYYYISQYFKDAVLSYHPDWLGKKEIDIYIPEINTAIEYDGEFWHRKKDSSDLEKSRKMREHGMEIVRFREQGLPDIDDGSCRIFVSTDKYSLNRLDWPIREMFWYLNDVFSMDIHVDVDTERDWKKILASKMSIKKKRSLAVQFPELAKTWNYEKNEGLVPENFFPQSSKKVWWKCPDCGYEWEELISNRTKRQKPCSRCEALRSHSRTLHPGINDLISARPEIAAEWNYDKNGDLRPENYTVGSREKVWWKCQTCGMEWESTICNRNTGFGCPKCGKIKAASSASRNRVVKGINDLPTLNPEVLPQWDYEKNGERGPEQYSANSNIKVWWKCPDCGNSWEATIGYRLHSKKCPFCINSKAVVGFNDVFTKAPGLRAEWDYEKNIGLDPAKLTYASTKKVWWKCSSCGYSWKAEIFRRVDGSGCRKCGSKLGAETRISNLVKKGNSLAEVYPDIAKEWHPTKNGIRKPEDIPCHSGEKVWWMCSKGHEWQATVNHRSNGTGCPKCAYKENGKIHTKKVMNLDTGMVFNSVTEASEYMHISINSLSYCINGKTKTCGGFRWRKV